MRAVLAFALAIAVALHTGSTLANHNGCHDDCLATQAGNQLCSSSFNYTNLGHRARKRFSGSAPVLPRVGVRGGGRGTRGTRGEGKAAYKRKVRRREEKVQRRRGISPRAPPSPPGSVGHPPPPGLVDYPGHPPPPGLVDHPGHPPTLEGHGPNSPLLSVHFSHELGREGRPFTEFQSYNARGGHPHQIIRTFEPSGSVIETLHYRERPLILRHYLPDGRLTTFSPSGFRQTVIPLHNIPRPLHNHPGHVPILGGHDTYFPFLIVFHHQWHNQIRYLIETRYHRDPLPSVIRKFSQTGRVWEIFRYPDGSTTGRFFRPDGRLTTLSSDSAPRTLNIPYPLPLDPAWLERQSRGIPPRNYNH